jgi:hypothetical protein
VRTSCWFEKRIYSIMYAGEEPFMPFKTEESRTLSGSWISRMAHIHLWLESELSGTFLLNFLRVDIPFVEEPSRYFSNLQISKLLRVSVP